MLGGDVKGRYQRLLIYMPAYLFTNCQKVPTKACWSKPRRLRLVQMTQQMTARGAVGSITALVQHVYHCYPTRPVMLKDIIDAHYHLDAASWSPCLLTTQHLELAQPQS